MDVREQRGIQIVATFNLRKGGDFLMQYLKRSNVETAFAMINGEFGDAVRSKSETAQVNEVLCNVLAHNLCVQVQAIYELAPEPAFWSDFTPAQDRRAVA